MSHQSLIITPLGPVITIYIGVAGARRQALEAAGQPVPAPVGANLLIDTGASCSCLDEAIIQALGINPTGQISIATPSTGVGSHTCNTYDVSMVVVPQPGHGTPKIFNALPVVESHFASQGIDGLLGRDVLARSTMHYDGVEQSVSITFI